MTVAQVEAKCEALGKSKCGYWIWSEDPKDTQWGAWFCAADLYDEVGNAAQFPLWRVGRRK